MPIVKTAVQRSIVFATLGPALIVIALTPITADPVPRTQTETPFPNPPKDDDDEDRGDILYRGVTKGHPGYPLAEAGIAMPISGNATPLQHNEDYNTFSIFTSWSRSKDWARFYANLDPRGGVVLTAKISKSRQVVSPDKYREQEVLVTGVVFGASVERVP